MQELLPLAFRDGLLAVTATNSDTVYNISLLGFVSKSACLIRSRWTRSTVDDVQLTVFPASDSNIKNKIITRNQSTNRTRRRKRRTSDCFFLYNSPIYLYAPILRLMKVTDHDYIVELSEINNIPFLEVVEVNSDYCFVRLNDYAVPSAITEHILPLSLNFPQEAEKKNYCKVDM